MPRPRVYESNFTGAEHIDAPHLIGSETVVSSLGTSTPSISAGRIDFTAGTCGNLELSDGSFYSLDDYSYLIAEDSGNHGRLNGVNPADMDTFWTEKPVLRLFRFDPETAFPTFVEQLTGVTPANDSGRLRARCTFTENANDADGTIASFELGTTRRINMYRDQPGGQFRVRVSSDNFSGTYNSGVFVTAGDPNQYELDLIYDSTKLRWYINGQLTVTFDLDFRLTPAGPLNIWAGRSAYSSSTSFRHTGNIHRVEYWNGPDKLIDWHCNEGTNTIINYGTLGGTADHVFGGAEGWVETLHGQFDGVDDSVSIPALNLNDYAITASVYPQFLGGVLVGQDASNRIEIVSANQITIQPGGTINLTTPLTTGQNHWLEFHRVGSAIQCYVDNVAQAHTLNDATVMNIDRLGAISTGSHFEGQIGMARLSDRLYPVNDDGDNATGNVVRDWMDSESHGSLNNVNASEFWGFPPAPPEGLFDPLRGMADALQGGPV